ncbi:MAG: extracellular solute-binding protein [Alphaproteobacteria bacterium]|nr:extracellular solute-binding protein [Alphaproteobacteria bacterium]
MTLKLFRALLMTGVLAAGWTSAAKAQECKPEDKKILTVWDQFEYYGMTASGPAVEKIHEAFQKEHPCVVFSRSVFGGGFPIRNAVELALTSGDAPDVFYSWPSGAGLTAYAKAGYLADLSPYAAKFKWSDRLPDWAIARNTYQGKQYAYPWEQDLEYVYYNKEAFKELGIDVPKSFDDVLAWCDKASAAGKIPISLGNGDLWPAVNMWTDVTALLGGRQVGLNLLQDKQDWNSAEPKAALEAILKMVEHKCFSPGYNGTSYNDALLQFYSGQATAIWTGTWVIQDVVRNMPEDTLDIFYMPPFDATHPQATHMSEGSAWYVWSGSKDKDLAAEYINFMSDPRWLETWIKDGYTIPIQKKPIDFAQYGISGVISKAFNTGMAMVDRNVDAFHTTAPPRVTFVMYHDIQGVLTGDTKPEDFLKKLDEQMEVAKQAGEVWAP